MERVALEIVGDVFRTCDVQIHDDRFLPAAHDHSLNRLIFARVQLLMWNEWGNVDEISRTCLVDKFQTISSAKTRPASDNIDHGL